MPAAIVEASKITSTLQRSGRIKTTATIPELQQQEHPCCSSLLVYCILILRDVETIQTVLHLSSTGSAVVYSGAKTKQTSGCEKGSSADLLGLQLLLGTDVTLGDSRRHSSATAPCLSRSDSHVQHCCQGYHLLTPALNFETRVQAAAWSDGWHRQWIALTRVMSREDESESDWWRLWLDNDGARFLKNRMFTGPGDRSAIH